MSQWKNVGAVVALSITAAFAGTGCLAQNADDDATDTEIAAADQNDGAVADESTTDFKQLSVSPNGLINPWFSGLIGCNGIPVFNAGFGGCWPGAGLFGLGGCGFGCGGLGFGATDLAFAGVGLGLAGRGIGIAGCNGWGNFFDCGGCL